MSFIHSKLDKVNQDQAVLFLSEMQAGIGFLGGRYFFHKDKPQEKLAFKEITEIFLKRCEAKTLESSPVIISQLTRLNSAGNALLNKNQGIAGRILRFFHAISQAFGNRFKKINHQLNIQRIEAFIPKVVPLTKIIPTIQRSVKLLDLSQEKNPSEASVPEPIQVKPKDIKAEPTAIQPSLDTTKVDTAIDTTKGALLTDLRPAEIGVEESPIMPPQLDPKDEVPVSLPTTAKTPVDTAIKIDSLQSSIIASEEIQANTASSILPSDKAPNLEEAPKSIPEPVYDLSQYQRELADSSWWLGGYYLTSPSVSPLNAEKEFETLTTNSYSRAIGEQERFNQLIRLLDEPGLNFDRMSKVLRLHLKIDNQSLLEPEKCISEISSQAKRLGVKQQERTKLELKLIAYYILSEILDKELSVDQKIVSIREFVTKFQKENSWIELQGVVKEVALICNSAQAKILLDCLIIWDQYVNNRAKSSSKPYSVNIANLIDYFLHGIFSENAYAEDGKRESIFERICQSEDSHKHLVLFFSSMRRNTDPFARQFSRNQQLSERMQKFIVSLILQRQSSREAHLHHLYELNRKEYYSGACIKDMRRAILDCLMKNPIPALSFSLESDIFKTIFPVEVSEPSDNQHLLNPQEVNYKRLFLIRMLNRLRLESGKTTVISKIVDEAFLQLKVTIPFVLVSMMVEYSEEISQAQSAIILKKVKIHYKRDLEKDSDLFNEIKALFNTKAA